MNKIYPHITISKEVLADLPTVNYPGGIGAVTMVDNISKTKIAIRAIKKHRLIGFDTETKPSFKRGQTNKVALLQLSTGAHCYLFRLTVPGIYEMIRPILEDQEIRKIGLSIHDDFNALRRRGELNPQGFLDLQDYCKSFFIEDISLQKIFAILFHEKISKSQRLTNWEAESLNESQQIYAAIDAWACLKIYNFLKSGDFNPYEVSSMFYSD